MERREDSPAWHDSEGPTAAPRSLTGGATATSKRHHDAHQASVNASAGASAADLSRLQEVLEQSANSLSGSIDLDRFASATLLTIEGQLGAACTAVFFHEPQTRTLRLRWMTLDGAALDVAVDPRAEVWRNPIPEDLTGAWQAITNSPAIVFEADFEDPNTWPFSVRWHRAMGHQSAICVALRSAGRAFGFLGVAFPRPGSELPPALALLCKALGQHLSVAIELTRLADAAREAAVARERQKAAEARVQELARANQVLRHAADALAAAGSVEEALGAFVREAMRVTGARAGAVCRFIEGTCCEFVAICTADGPIDPQDLRALPFAQALPAVSAADPTGYFARLARGETAFLTVDELACWFPEGAAWHAREGHRSVWDVPFFLRGQLAGHLRLAFETEQEPDQSARETLEGLASQCATALGMMRLGEEARATAVAREREAAETVRARELERANQALQRTVVGLSGSGEAAGFYHRVLVEMCEVVRASQGSLFLLSRSGSRVTKVARVTGGVPDAVTGTSDEDGWALDVPSFAEAWARIQAAPITFESLANGDLIYPVRRGSSTLGFLLFANRSGSSQAELSHSLMVALAQQVALAVELTRLSEEAREAEVAHERRLAAEARATELAKANQALRRGVDRISALESEAEILAAFIAEAVALAGASAGAVLRRTGDTRFEMAAVHAGGTLVPESQWRDDVMVRKLREVSERDPVGHWAQVAAGAHRWTDVVSSYAGWFDENVAFHQRMGHRFLWDFPFRVGQHVTGMLGLAFRDGPEPAGVVAETVRTLANACALALRLMDMGERNREAALARERQSAAERRASELHIANEALRRAIAGLSEGLPLSDFLAEMLRASLALAGATNGAVALMKGDEVEHPVLIEGDRVVPREEQERNRTWRVPLHPDLRRAAMQQPGEIWNTPPEEVVHTAGMQAYHARVGNLAIRLVPLVVGQSSIGWIGLGFNHPNPTFDERTELVLFIARQITAALEMSRLADEAREAALSREREQAARDRAHKLARANDSLRRAAELISNVDDFEHLLGHVLLAITAQLNATSSAVWLLDPDQRQARMQFVVEDGVLRRASESQHPNKGAPPPTTDAHRSSLKDFARAQAAPDLSKATDRSLTDEQRDYFARVGCRALLRIPMTIGGDHVGLFTVRWTSDDDPQPEELQLVQTLANQASLALKLTRLAQAARQEERAAAVAEERNRLARELHDTLTQGLAMTAMHLEVARTKLKDAWSLAGPSLDLVARLAAENLRAARRAIAVLRPDPIDHGGIAVAVERIAAEARLHHPSPIHLDITGAPRRFQPDVELELVRIIQAAVTNAVRHAGPDAKLIVELAFDAAEGGGVRAAITDTGSGFELSEVSAESFGIRGMRERAARIGAVVTFVTAPGEGTQVILRWRDEPA